MKNKVIALPKEMTIDARLDAIDKNSAYHSLTMDQGAIKALDGFLKQLASCKTEKEKSDWLVTVNSYFMTSSKTIQDALSKIHNSREINQINVHNTITYIQQKGWEVPNTPTISAGKASNHDVNISEGTLNNIVTSFIKDNAIPAKSTASADDFKPNGKTFEEIKTIAKQILIELSNGTNIDEDNLPAGFLAILTFRTTGKTGCGPWDGIVRKPANHNTISTHLTGAGNWDGIVRKPANHNITSTHLTGAGNWDGIVRKPANHKNFTAEWEASGTGPMKDQIKTLPLSPETKAIVDEFMAGITAKLEIDETIRKFNEFIASNPSIAEELRNIAQQAREEGQSHTYPAFGTSFKNFLKSLNPFKTAQLTGSDVKDPFNSLEVQQLRANVEDAGAKDTSWMKPGVAGDIKTLAQKAFAEEGQSHPYPALASLKGIFKSLNPFSGIWPQLHQGMSDGEQAKSLWRTITAQNARQPSFLDKVAGYFTTETQQDKDMQRRIQYTFGQSWVEAEDDNVFNHEDAKNNNNFDKNDRPNDDYVIVRITRSLNRGSTQVNCYYNQYSEKFKGIKSEDITDYNPSLAKWQPKGESFEKVRKLLSIERQEVINGYN